MNVILALTTLLFVGYAAAEETPKYTTKWDSIDIDALLKNERMLSNYVKCLLEQGTCTPDATELKNTMPDAIQTDCAKCSQKQKEGSARVMQYIIDNKPEEWKTLEEKYDPEGAYKKNYFASKNMSTSTMDPTTAK